VTDDPEDDPDDLFKFQPPSRLELLLYLLIIVVFGAGFVKLLSERGI